MAQHVVIVGAGIIGASVTYHLAKQGAAVTVLERSCAAACASGTSFGWVNANFAETPEYFALRRASIDALRAVSAELDLHDCLRWSGCLWWEDTGKDFTDHADELAGFGYEAEVIDAARFAALEPNIAEPPVASIYSQIEGAADGEGLTNALLTAAAMHGARLVTGCDVHRVVTAGDRITAVETSLGQIACDAAVIAVGAASQTLLAPLDIAVPMDNKPGLLLHTTPMPPVLNSMIMSTDVHAHQLPDGRMIVGEIFSGGVHPDRDTLEFAQDILARLNRRIPKTAEAKIARIKLGTRPVPTDGLPVIGESRIQNLHVAVMHSGITLAALVGEIVADEVLNGTKDPRLATFRMNRFNQTS